MASPGRVQVREFEREGQLNPAPVVNVVPVAPVNREGAGKNLMSIADALSGLSTSFGRFAANNAAYAKQERDKAGTTAANYAMGQSPDELMADMAANPQKYSAEQMQLMFADKMAVKWSENLPTLYEEWDKQGSFQDFVSGKQAQFVQENFPGYANDEKFIGYFNKAVEPYNSRMANAHGVETSKQFAAEKVDLITSHITNMVADGQNKGISPSIMSASIFRELQSLAPWKSMSGEDRDKLILGYVESLTNNPNATKEDRELAERLLKMPRPVDHTAPARNTTGGSIRYDKQWQMAGVKSDVADRARKASAMFGRELVVQSGHRSKEYNASVGGAKGSRHMHGDALDISMAGMTDAEKKKLVASLSAAGFKRIIGYDGMNAIHVDMAEGYTNSPNAKVADGIYVMWNKSESNNGSAPQWYKEGIIEGMAGGVVSDAPSTGEIPSLYDNPKYTTQAQSLLDAMDTNFRVRNWKVTSELETEFNNTFMANPLTATSAQMDEFQKKAEDYFTPDQLMNLKQRFEAEKIKAQQKVQAQQAHVEQKHSVIGEVLSDIETGSSSGAGVSALIDGVEIASDKEPGKTTTFSAEEVKKEATNALFAAAEQKFPGNIQAQVLFMTPYLKKGQLKTDRWKDQISQLMLANSAEKLKEGLSDQDKATAELLGALLETGEIPFVNSITPEGGRTFVDVFALKKSSGLTNEEALRQTYMLMSDPDRPGRAFADVEQVRNGWNHNASFVERMGSVQGGELLRKRLQTLALAGADVKDENVVEQAAEWVNTNHVKVGRMFIPKRIMGWGDNTGEDIKGIIEDIVPKIGGKMYPPVEDLENVTLIEVPDGYALIDMNTGNPFYAKGPRGEVDRTKTFVIRKDDVDAFRKVRNARATIPAEVYQERFINAAGKKVMIEEIVIDGRGIDTFFSPGTEKVIKRPATPAEIIEMEDAANAKSTDEAVSTATQKEIDASPTTKVQEGTATLDERIDAARSFFPELQDKSDEEVIQFLKDRGAIPNKQE